MEFAVLVAFYGFQLIVVGLPILYISVGVFVGSADNLPLGPHEYDG
jgi:hypothetical protein